MIEDKSTLDGEMEKMFSIVESAKKAGVEKETVYRAVWAGHLPARRRGNPRTGRLFITQTNLERWIRGRDYSDERRIPGTKDVTAKKLTPTPKPAVGPKPAVKAY